MKTTWTPSWKYRPRRKPTSTTTHKTDYRGGVGGIVGWGGEYCGVG